MRDIRFLGYNRDMFFDYMKHVEKNFDHKLVYHPMEEKPYYLIGTSPFTSTVKSMEDLMKVDHRKELMISIEKNFVNIALHNHDYYELMFVYSGVIETKIDEEVIRLKAGDICILNKKAYHSIRTDEGVNISFSAIMSDDLRTELLRYLPEEHPYTQFLNEASVKKNYLFYETHKYERIADIGRRMMEEKTLNRMGVNSQLIGLLYQLNTELLRIYPLLGVENIKGQDELSIHRLIRFMEQNYKDVSVSSISDYFHFNPNYLSRMIKKETGKNFSQILKEIRLDKAKILLEYTNKSIEEIAYDIGYSSLSHFYKIFREVEGVTPMEYKQKVCKNTERVDG